MVEHSSEERDQRLRELAALMPLYESGRHQQAIDLSATLIARRPDYYAFHLIRARSYLALEDYEAAIPCFQETLRLVPGEKHSVEALALCFRKVGRTDEVVSYFTEMFRTTPTVHTASALMRIAFAATTQDLDLIHHLMRSLYPDHFKKYPHQKIYFSPYVPFTDWCGANGILFDTIDPGGEVRLTHVDGTPVEPYKAPPIQFATIPDARIVTSMDWVITAAGEFLDGSGLSLLAASENHAMGGEAHVPTIVDTPRNRVLHARSKSEIHIDEDVVYLSGRHYGHWIYDHLPRLMAWRRPVAGPRKIFIPANLPSAQRQTLARFGVTGADLIEGADDGQLYRFRSATALRLGDTQRATPLIAKFLSHALAINHAPLPADETGERYYLERSHTKRGRAIANRAEFQAVLDDFGFKTIRRPDLSVSEQEAKFSQASIIISPFGSDVVTYFQLRPGTDFIVLNFENMERVYPEIEQIPVRYCAILGMRYHAVSCELQRHPGKIAYHGDMIVDCKALRRTLAGITARRATREGSK